MSTTDIFLLLEMATAKSVKRCRVSLPLVWSHLYKHYKDSRQQLQQCHALRFSLFVIARSSKSSVHVVQEPPQRQYLKQDMYSNVWLVIDILEYSQSGLHIDLSSGSTLQFCGHTVVCSFETSLVLSPLQSTVQWFIDFGLHPQSINH